MGHSPINTNQDDLSLAIRNESGEGPHKPQKCLAPQNCFSRGISQTPTAFLGGHYRMWTHRWTTVASVVKQMLFHSLICRFCPFNRQKLWPRSLTNGPGSPQLGRRRLGLRPRVSWDELMFI